MARRFYRRKSFDVIEETYQKKVKELEDAQQADSSSIEKLRQERDQANAAAEKASEELAKNRPGQGSELYQNAMRLFLAGKIQEAIDLLDDETLRRSIAQAEKKIADAVRAWLLKARLFSLKLRFEEALKAYESALAIILWNTMYLERAISALREHGIAFPDALLTHVSPIGREHINLTGDYT